MNILTVCAEGNNRSVTLAHFLKYQGHDVIPIGTKRASTSTCYMLFNWADKIITVDKGTYELCRTLFDDPSFVGKLAIWDIGPDSYPRPFNRELFKICKRLVDQNPL